MTVYESDYKGRKIKRVFMREEQSGLEAVHEACEIAKNMSKELFK